MYDIDRKTASRLLKLSTRTVDRYIVAKKISIERRDGRIWLDKKEILRFRASHSVDSGVHVSSDGSSTDKADLLSVDMSIDDNDNISKGSENNSNSVYQGGYSRRERVTGDENNANHPGTFSQDQVYKKLFEELQNELKNYRERLEMANYRVGQLEANLKDSIPLLEYNRNFEKLKFEQEQLHHNFDTQSGELEQVRVTLKDERFNKKVYLIILFILLLLQPLWFIFPMK